jgi:hypothetical protein
VEDSCECGNEPSVSIKCWEVLEWLHTTGGLSSSAPSVKAHLHSSARRVCRNRRRAKSFNLPHSDVRNIMVVYRSKLSRVVSLLTCSGGGGGSPGSRIIRNTD